MDGSVSLTPEQLAALGISESALESVGAEPEAPPAPKPSPLQALADSVAAAPDTGFVGHLEKLAEDGIRAVGLTEPQIEAAVALLSDLVKVKL